jgi:hypothetical protein
MQGKVIMQKTFSGKMIHFNIEHIASATYLVIVQLPNSKQRFVRKIVKE